MNILIVEDDKNSAETLSSVLEKKFQGAATCFIVNTLKEGLEFVNKREIEIHVTLMDLCLPDASIEEVISSIKRFPPPVIILTALDDSDSSLEINCYENYAQNFFTKEELRDEIYNSTGSELISSITKAFYRDYLPKIKENRDERRKSLLTH